MRLRLRSAAIVLGLALRGIGRGGARRRSHAAAAAGASELGLDAGAGPRRRVLRAYTTAEGAWRLPADVAQIDPRFLRFLLAYEDQRFRTHPGVDPLAAGARGVAGGRAMAASSRAPRP